MKTRSAPHPLIPGYLLRRRRRNLTHALPAARCARRPTSGPPGWDFSPPPGTGSVTQSFSHTPAPARQGSLKTT